MYSGQIAHISFGNLGLLTDVPPSQVPRGAFVKANNISYETGLITKSPGSLKYNTSALPASVVAFFDWWPDVASQRLIALCSDGSVYRDIGDRVFSLNVPIHSDLMNVTPKAKFVEGGGETAGREKKLFLFTGTNQVKVLSGDESEMATIENPAADWTSPNYPKVGLIHRNRLWAFMGQRAYASNTGNHEDFVTSDEILTESIFPGEGGDILGAFVFKGRLFAFKEGGYVYSLDDTDVDSDNWVWRKLASNFGLSSISGIMEIGNDLIAINESGSPTSYNAVQALGDIESADVFRLLQIENFMRENTSVSGLEYVHAMYYEAKKQAFFTGRTTYKTQNDLLIHIDFNKESPRVALWSKDQANCLGLRKDVNKILRPCYGASDGYIYLMDREDRLVGGSAYTGEFKTGHMDFGFLDEKIAHKNKLFDYLAIEFKPCGRWNLEVDVYIDGNFMETISFSMDVRDDGLDTFTLDTDPLGREETQTIQKPLHGSGRRISFHCRQAGANQNFAIAAFDVGFRLSGEQAARV